jgi:hypothetical protein
MSQLKKYSSLLFLLTALLTTIFINLSCEDNPVTPNEPPPGRRDYEWSIDTLKPEGDYVTYMFNMWGSSPTDIWLVGSADTRLHAVWHYDGNEWYPVVLDEPVNCGGLWGFAQDDIWMGTTNSQIWHYDGSSWKKYGTYPYKDFDRVLIQRIHGQKPDDVYAVGWAGINNQDGYHAVIMHYDGTDWKYEEFGKVEENFGNVFVDKDANIPVIHSIDFNSTTAGNVIYKYVEGSLVELYRGGDHVSLGHVAGKAIITIDKLGKLTDKVLYRFDGTTLVKYKDFPFINFVGNVTGRNSNDIFCSTSDWYLGHYNGTDLADLLKTNINIAEILLFDKNVFIWGRDVDTYYDTIVHGVLK